MHPRKRVTPTIDDALAFSVDDFCRRYGISSPLFYKLRDEMPVTFTVGKRVLVSRAAADEWRKAKEKEAAGKVA